MGVRVILQGGLGNQLFQIVEALRVAQPTAIVLDVSALAAAPSRGVAQRTFESLELAKASGMRVTRRAVPAVSYRRAANLVTLKCGGRLAVGNTTLITGPFITNELQTGALVRLAECVRAAFRPSGFERLDGQAVHVRLGDYRNLEAVYGPMSERYYSEACRSVLDMSQPVAVFSDEPEVAVTILGSLMRDVDWRMAASCDWPRFSDQGAWQDLLAMMSCARLVTANSTYSWWSAVLQSRLVEGAVSAAPTAMKPTGLRCPSTACPFDWAV